MCAFFLKFWFGYLLIPLDKRLNAPPRLANACSGAHLVTLNTQGNSMGFIALKAFFISNAVGFWPAAFFPFLQPPVIGKASGSASLAEILFLLIAWIFYLYLVA